MAHTSPVDYLGESRLLSSLIIEEILHNITSASPSFTKPVDLDAPDSSIGYRYLIPGCIKDRMTDGDKMVGDVQELPVAKKVTFSEDVTVVSYELATADQEQNSDAGLVMMEDEQEKEAFLIYETEEGVLASSATAVGDVFREKKVFCDGDSYLLKRKCFGSDVEDDCMIPTKSMKPLFGHQNEYGPKADGSLFHDDKSKAKVQASKTDVEIELKVSDSQDITVALRESDEEHESTPTKNPSERNCKVQDNPLTHTLCQGDEDDTNSNDSTLPNELPSSNDYVIDDCRSVLQSIVDNILRQMVLNSKSTEITNSNSDSDEQPPAKKMKLDTLSGCDTPENFSSNSTVPGLLSKKEIESSLNNMPQLADTSTADVEQLCFSETTDIKAYIIELAVLSDNLSLDLPSERKSENGYRVLQNASDSSGVTGVSTSTPDAMEDEDEDIDSTVITKGAEISLSLSYPSPLGENDNLTSNDNLCREAFPHPSTTDVKEVEDIQDATPRGESKAYSSVLVEDLYLDNSVEGSEPSEVFKLGMRRDEECIDGNPIPSSADVEVVKLDDGYVHVDAIEPSLQEDIMPSQESSGDDFSCTFKKASQSLTNSRDEELCSHPLRKLDDLLPADLHLEMTNRDLYQVSSVASGKPVKEELMHDAVVDDWEATLSLPAIDDSISIISEISVLGHPYITQEPENNLQHGDSKCKDSPKQNASKSEEKRNHCTSRPNEALTTLMKESSSKDIEEMDENEPFVPLLHLMYQNRDFSPMEDYKVKSTSEVDIDKELSRVEVKVSSDQTVPSLQTPIKDNPCIDQLLGLEESIFAKQDTCTKPLEGKRKQSIPVRDKKQFTEDGEGKPIPDHLQTLGQHAAGVFQWNHSLLDPSLTPSLTQDQSTLQYRANRLDQTPPITPVRPLPVCHRRRRVGLSRRQLVYPLHARTFLRK